jgi:hypothetical protein
MTYTFKLSRRIASNHRGSLAALALLLAACGAESPTSNTPAPLPAAVSGWLTVQLATPNSDDGAVQIAVSGPGVDSAKVLGYDGYAAVANTNANLIVTGAITNGSIARIFVRDLSQTSRVQATVVAAAARSSYALQELNGYRAVLVR